MRAGSKDGQVLSRTNELRIEASSAVAEKRMGKSLKKDWPNADFFVAWERNTSQMTALFLPDV